ncbi:MAG: PASTA domain-containing protein, partial [Comamonadaceae bacterium]
MMRNTVKRPAMLGKRLGAVIAAALTGILLTACDDKMSSGAPSDVIPDVIGMTLLDAKDELDPTGLDVETIDITGQDRMVLVEGNWFVAGQDLPAGQPAGDRTTITLSIGKEGEARPPASPSGAPAGPPEAGA